MIHHLLTPLELASLSAESKQRLEEALVMAFLQGADEIEQMTALKRADYEREARAMLRRGQLGIRASRWFSKIPKSVDFDTCE